MSVRLDLESVFTLERNKRSRSLEYALMQAKEKRILFEVPEGYVPLTPGDMEFDYKIIPDRDLNGAGLLYFANYPMFLDIAERNLLSVAGGLALDESLLDRRTLVHRKSSYLSNATANDVLKIKIQAWIENPFLAGTSTRRRHRLGCF